MRLGVEWLFRTCRWSAIAIRLGSLLMGVLLSLRGCYWMLEFRRASLRLASSWSVWVDGLLMILLRLSLCVRFDGRWVGIPLFIRKVFLVGRLNAALVCLGRLIRLIIPVLFMSILANLWSRGILRLLML